MVFVGIYCCYLRNPGAVERHFASMRLRVPNASCWVGAGRLGASSGSTAGLS